MQKNKKKIQVQILPNYEFKMNVNLKECHKLIENLKSNDIDFSLYNKNIKCDAIVVFRDGGYLDLKIYNSIKKNKIKLIYFMWESPLHKNHRGKRLLRLKEIYDFIITWDDNIIDYISYFGFRHYIYSLKENDYQHNINTISENEYKSKKLFTMIVGNNYSSVHGELYSERLKIIKFFEEFEENIFDFYGYGWGNNFNNYKDSIPGWPGNKEDVYKKYRFAFCLENYDGRAGYITEKIFDCFACGIVPIYKGASNILDYIPENTFIQYDNFKDLSQLIEHCQNMKLYEYNEYIKNIRLYLNSSDKNIFTFETFINKFRLTLLEMINSTKIENNNKNIFNMIVIYIHILGDMTYVFKLYLKKTLMNKHSRIFMLLKKVNHTIKKIP